MATQDNEKIIWVMGNRQQLIIPMEQEVIPAQGEPYTEDFYPAEGDVVKVTLTGAYRPYIYTPDVDGHLLILTEPGTLPKGLYGVQITVVGSNGETRLRSFWDHQIVVTEKNNSVLKEWDEFKEQPVTARAAVFFFAKGDKGEPLTYEDLTEAQIEELQKPARDAATEISEDYNTNVKGDYADLKIDYATNVKDDYANVKQDAQASTGAANDAADLANTKAGLADDAAALANEKAGLADDAAALANEKAALADEKATLADEKATEAGRVNATINGTTLTVTDRNGESTSSDVQGPAGPPGRTVQSDWSQDNPSADDYIKNKPDIYTKQQTDSLLGQKQDVIQDLQTIRDNAKDGKQALTDVQAIEEKIPQQASSQNQLADKNFVNSSVATNTAYYISDNGQPFASLADLEAYSGTLTNNDYAFVVGTDSAGNTTYTRYKYNADTGQWAEEYVLNNSSFTAEQWAAISSGITSGDVEKLRALPTKAQLDLLFDGKQNVIDDLSTIRSGAAAGATAVQPAAIANMEVTSNKVTAISDQSTNTQYPSAKAVYDFVGGALSKYVEHGTDDTTFMLTPNCFHIWGEVAALTLTLPSLLLPGYEFVFQFTSGATATALSLPSSLKWFTPHTVKDRTLYQVRILNGCASMQGVDISLAGDPYVDLGLPSGVKWAKRNIDVTRDSGFTSSDYEYDCSFFSWGNIDGHNPTSSSSFSPWDWGGANASEPWYEGQVYGSTPGNTLTGNIPVGAEYDAARAILGSPWRMPTSSEYQELLDNTIFLDANGDEIPATTTNKLVTIDGIVGLRLASKINGNELFFPCSGNGDGTSRYGRGLYGDYWSSTCGSARDARTLSFYSSGVYPQNYYNRYLGFAVRAVQ